MTAAVVLYGPPASGKDTVTAALTERGGYRLVPRCKAGPGRTTGYRVATREQIDALRATPGEVLWETERYQSTYVLTRTDLLAVTEHAVPVVHVGQLGAIPELLRQVPGLVWTVVELRCPRAVSAARIAARGTGDDGARLAAYDATPRLDGADVVIDTSHTSPGEAARLIHQAVTVPSQ